MADQTLAMASRPRPITRGEAFGLLAGLVVMWGLHWPIMKIALVSMTPLWFAVARVGLGAIALFAWVAATGRLILPTRHDWSIVLGVGLMQMALQTCLSAISIALMHVPAGRSAVLAYTVPMWVAPGAALFLRERLTRLKLAGLAFGMLGVAVLFNPLEFDWTHRESVIGNGMMVFAAITWGAVILQIRSHRFRHSPVQLAPWQLLVALIVVLPLALVFEGDAKIDWSPGLVVILLYSGVIATGLAFTASLLITRALPAITTSLGLIGVPIAGVASSTLLVGEDLPLSLVLAMLLVIVGLVLITLADAREGRRAA
jgi:drug/metabolite transporter (DMT)-like permease